MDTFVGSLDALKGLVEKTGHRGAWSVIAHGYEFRSNDGVVLDWFPSLTNEIRYQGPIEATTLLRLRGDRRTSAFPSYTCRRKSQSQIQCRSTPTPSLSRKAESPYADCANFTDGSPKAVRCPRLTPTQ